MCCGISGHTCYGDNKSITQFMKTNSPGRKLTVRWNYGRLKGTVRSQHRRRRAATSAQDRKVSVRVVVRQPCAGREVTSSFYPVPGVYKPYGGRKVTARRHANHRTTTCKPSYDHLTNAPRSTWGGCTIWSISYGDRPYSHIAAVVQFSSHMGQGKNLTPSQGHRTANVRWPCVAALLV